MGEGAKWLKNEKKDVGPLHCASLPKTARNGEEIRERRLSWKFVTFFCWDQPPEKKRMTHSAFYASEKKGHNTFW